MGSLCGQRIQSRVGLPASLGSGPALHSTPSIGGRAGGSRDLQASEQGSSEKGFSLHRPVREQDIHGDQEGRLLSTSGESETIEPVCDKEAFQDGECGNALDFAQEGRLDDHHRPQGHLSLSTNSGRPQEVSSLPVEGGALYKFQCLPFGLTSAPRVLLRPVVAVLRQQGIRCMIFINDLLLLHPSKEELKKITTEVVTIFVQLGFLINQEKSGLIPSQRTVFLGFTVDSVSLTRSLTMGRFSRNALMLFLKNIPQSGT